jgi:hypothetical protein
MLAGARSQVMPGPGWGIGDAGHVALSAPATDTHPAAQYRYTDSKGVTKTTQYKLDVPAPHRDAAVWIGATGVGNPGLSEEQRKTKLRDDAYRRMGGASERRGR